MEYLTITAPGATPKFATGPVPTPADSEIQVKIAATALNFADLLMMKGRYQETPPFPLVPGLEVAGTVTEIGVSVSTFEVGDRIAAITGQGGLAEYATFEATRALLLPDTIDFPTAAAFQVAYVTAHLSLIRRARLLKSEKVVILGAAGGAGLAAVEVAKAAGATVIAVARGTKRLKVARKSGADFTLDSTDNELIDLLYTHAPYDVLYDAVGGAQGTAAARHLRPEGRHLLIGFASGAHPVLQPNHLLVKNIDVIGVNISAYHTTIPKALKDSLNTLLEWHASGTISPHIGHRYTFDNSIEALDFLASRQATGKIVVTQ